MPPRSPRFCLPPRASAAELLARLGADPVDAAAVIGAWPQEADTDIWRALERAYHTLVADLGNTDVLQWPDVLPASFGETGRYLYAYVFLAAVEDVRAYHHERAIPNEVSWATLADFGRQLRRDRRLFGGGLRAHPWLTLHFRGALYELGRLQFNRMRLRHSLAPAPFSAGDDALGVHIYEGSPLAPAACDASLEEARGFFARHFPETPTRIAVCTSWLLDEQLADYLPAESNIVRFGRRFQLTGGYDGDLDILQFVFGRLSMPDLALLPQRTTLERAIVAHWRAGKHWRSRTGWLEL
jgi:GNAT-like C-terminal domain/N-acyltransferase N-terminal domain